MTGRRRLGSLALLRRELAPGPVAILLVVLVALAVFAVALAPRLLDRIGNAELRDRLAAATPLVLDISGNGHLGIPDESGTAGLDELVGSSDTAIRELPDRVEEPLRSAIGDAVWLVRTPADDLDPEGSRPRTRISLVVDLRWEERIRFVDGTAPTAWTGSESSSDPQPPVEVALSAPAAEELGLGVGDELADAGRVLRIAGLYLPRDPGDPYWAHTGDLAEAYVEREPGVAPVVGVGAYVAPETLARLPLAFGNGPLTVWLPVDPARLAFADIPVLSPQARNAPTVASGLPFGGTVGLHSGLADELDRVAQRMSSLSGLLALCVSGLAGVLVAVLALAIRALLDRHATALRLAAARGASPLQLRLAMLGFGALVCLPPATVGVLVAALVAPARVDAAGWAAPAVVAAVPIALFGLLVSPSPLATRRDLTVRGGGRVRLTAELALGALSIVVLVLLSRRGLAGPSTAVGIDPLLSAAPLLLAVTASVVVLRLYPFPLGVVRRALRRGGGAVGMLGAARAERDPALGHVPALALIVGVAVVVSAAVLASTVRHGLETAARETVGADIQVSAPDLGDDVLSAIRGVPGVDAAVPLVIAPGIPFRTGVDDGGVLLVVADTAALHGLRPDVPELPTASGAAVPVLASDDWAEQLAGDSLGIGDADVTVAGVVARQALPGAAKHWLLVDERDVSRLGVDVPGPGRVLISLAAGADAADVAAEVREAVADRQTIDLDIPGVVVVRDVETTVEASRTPVIASIETGLLGVAGAALLLTMLAVALATAGAAAGRNRLLGVLRVLGMSRRQVRGVLAWELGPLALASVVAGTGLGLVLPVVVTSALDLRPFLGGREQPGVAVDPGLLLAAIGAFVVVVLISGAVAVVLGRRLAPAGAIKMGEP